MNGANNGEPAILPNTAEAVAFLNEHNPNAYHHLVAITPDGPVVAKTFAPRDSAGLAEFIDGKQGKANLYYHVNQLNNGVRDRKAKKADISNALFLQADIDDVNALTRLLNYPLPPTVVIASGGGGVNALWAIEPTQDLDGVEAANKRLVVDLDADPAATDVSRILRLPGTINLPTKTKLAKGRVPALAKFLAEHSDWSRHYRLEDFPTIVESSKSVSVILASPKDKNPSADPPPCVMPEGLDERTQYVILHGDDPEAPRGSLRPRYKSRSEAVFAAACTMARLSCTKEIIAGVLLNPEYKISEAIRDKKNPTSEAVRQANKALFTVGKSWPDGDKNGIPKRGLQNTQAALLRFGVDCSFDEFRQRMFVAGAVIQTSQGELTDKACNILRDIIDKQFKFDPGKEMTFDAIQVLCYANVVNPVLEYIDGLVWDQVPRIEHWLVDFASAEDTLYARNVSAIMLIAAVRRARQPGVKFDTIPVLEGPQGSGKSSLLKIMAGEDFFSDVDLLALDTKAQMEVMEGVWIFELCELAGMRHTEVNKIKAFASRSVDKARMAYGRVSETKARRGILVGTTNDDTYLKDETGNRRFWPVATGDIDLEGLSFARDQLWAEAAHREAAGESIVLPKELWGFAAKEQGLRTEPDPWQDIVNEHPDFSVFNGKELASSNYLLDTVLKISPGQSHAYHYKHLAKVMKSLGWEGPATINMESGKKLKGYWRMTPKPECPF